MFKRPLSTLRGGGDEDSGDDTLLDETYDEIPSPSGPQTVHLSQAPLKDEEELPYENYMDKPEDEDDSSILVNPLPHDFLRIHRNNEGQSRNRTGNAAGGECAHVKGTPATVYVDVQSANLPTRIMKGLYVKVSIVGGKGFGFVGTTSINQTNAKKPFWHERVAIGVPVHVDTIVVNVEVISENYIKDDNAIGCASIDATNIADGSRITCTYDLEEPRLPSYDGPIKHVGDISLCLQYKIIERHQPLAPRLPVASGHHRTTTAPSPGEVLYTADGRPVVVDQTGRVQAIKSNRAPQSSAPPYVTPAGTPAVTPAVTPAQIAEIKGMFPDFSDEVIEAIVRDAGSAEAAIDHILAMS